jgi:hypothetical protein
MFEIELATENKPLMRSGPSSDLADVANHPITSRNDSKDDIEGRGANAGAVFTPGETIAGSVRWSELPSATSIEIRLIWYTIGKGDRDSQYVGVETIANPQPQGQADFQFLAPHRPNSFSGKLIAIQWAVEVIAFPQREAQQELLTINPATGPVETTPVDKSEAFWETSLRIGH